MDTDGIMVEYIEDMRIDSCPQQEAAVAFECIRNIIEHKADITVGDANTLFEAGLVLKRLRGYEDAH